LTAHAQLPTASVDALVPHLAAQRPRLQMPLAQSVPRRQVSELRRRQALLSAVAVLGATHTHALVVRSQMLLVG